MNPEDTLNIECFQLGLADELSVLFCYIGWAEKYDGTEPPRGSHEYIKDHPGDLDISEVSAFDKINGLFTCGIGKGNNIRGRIHVVFVARDPRGSKDIKVVGIYAGAPN